MTFTIPDADDLWLFWGDDAPDDAVRANTFLGLAASLLKLATGLTDDPTDPDIANLVKYAICDLAIMMYSSRENIDEAYSPYSSERIGSYSYTKAVRAINANMPTGAALFDKVVAYFTDLALEGADGSWVTSTCVFPGTYTPLWAASRRDWYFGTDSDTWGNWTSWYAPSSADQDAVYYSGPY